MLYTLLFFEKITVFSFIAEVNEKCAVVLKKDRSYIIFVLGILMVTNVLEADVAFTNNSYGNEFAWNYIY